MERRLNIKRAEIILHVNNETLKSNFAAKDWKGDLEA